MSRARPIFPNTTYFETKRTASRELRFAGTVKEREEISNIVLYCLAHAANKYGIEVHGCTLMDNHPHTLYTDVWGRDPRFRQLKNSLIARAMNVLQGRKGSFWSPDRCVQVLRDRDAVLDSFAYMAANPVKHGVVERARDFPGLSTSAWEIGHTITIRKPAVLFREENLPPAVCLTLTIPPALRQLPRHVGLHHLHNAAQERECWFRQRHQDSGKSFLGVATLHRTRPTDRPNERDEERRRPDYIKCFDPALRRATEQQLRQFRQAYADASTRWGTKEDVRSFPFGTWRTYLIENAPIASP